MSHKSYTFGKVVAKSFDEAVKAATAALATEGFGVLTEIDIAATMKKKLNKDMPPYKILGACNPNYAFHALSVEPEAGALLPCNIVVRQDTAGAVHVEIMDPDAVLGMAQSAELKEVAGGVREKLERALAAI
ncbi:hypothetical protein DFJ74DRAFT_677960 [Hyaloraphidium curvatum]|nr:hypothetical protein DFJ74DRAFT_677960 [Hyaloraphidium curvatum]